MQAVTRTTNPLGRRLAGSFLYALTISAVGMPVAVWVVGLALGPQALREKIVVTVGRFAEFHGRTGLLLVMLGTVVVLTLYNLAVGPRRRYAWNWAFAPMMFDDALSAREKLSAVLASWWGRALLALVALWIGLAFFEGR